jgi:hypothetical protein
VAEVTLIVFVCSSVRDVHALHALIKTRGTITSMLGHFKVALHHRKGVAEIL